MTTTTIDLDICKPALRYLDAEQKNFSLCKAAEEVFSEESLLSEDGVPLSIYQAGNPDNPTVVLINPMGMPFLFMTKLAALLAADYHVVTWEGRGLSHTADLGSLNSSDAPLEMHCRDLLSILHKKDLRSSAIISFCSGANVAIYGLAHGLLDTERLCLVSPSLEISNAGKKTDYQRSILPLWCRIAKEGVRTAALVRTLLQQSTNNFDSKIDEELAVINNLPFQSNEMIYLYAQLQAHCMADDFAPFLAKIPTPTMVIHTESDDMIHVDTVRAIANALPNSQLEWILDGGHFAIYKSQAMQEKIRDFLRA